MAKRKLGFYENIPNEEYHSKDGFYSSSVLKTAYNDEKEWYRVYIQGKPPKKLNEAALLVGSFVHSQLLEPTKTWEEFLVFDGIRRGKEYDAFIANAQGRTVLGKAQHDESVRLIQAFQSTQVTLDGVESISAQDLFLNGKAEWSLYHKLNGLHIKIRPDYLIEFDDHLVCRDLKTTSSIADSVKSAKGVVDGLDYDISAALYKDVLEDYFKKPVVYQWVFLSKANLETTVYGLSEKTYNKGKEKYQKGIDKIKKWVDTKDYSDIFKIKEL